MLFYQRWLSSVNKVCSDVFEHRITDFKFSWWLGYCNSTHMLPPETVIVNIWCSFRRHNRSLDLAPIEEALIWHLHNCIRLWINPSWSNDSWPLTWGPDDTFPNKVFNSSMNWVNWHNTCDPTTETSGEQSQCSCSCWGHNEALQPRYDCGFGRCSNRNAE